MKNKKTDVPTFKPQKPKGKLSKTVTKWAQRITSKQLKIAGIVLAYIVILLLSLHITAARARTGNFIEALFLGLDTFTDNPFVFTELSAESMISSLGIATLVAAFAGLWWCVEKQRNAQTMPGKENGSAKFCNAKDIAAYNRQYTDPYGETSHDGPNNDIFTQNICLGTNTRKTLRNRNAIVIGGAGAGKSRFFVKPNILQANSNYVITDPAGELLASTGTFLQEQGYEITVFNLVEMQKSHRYNPFQYIRNDPGVLSMINCLIKNTNPPGATKGDPFWEKSETALLQALCFYLIHHNSDPARRNFSTVMEMLRMAEVNEQNPNAKSPLDLLFDEVAASDPNSIALKQYRTFKMGAGKTLKSILISVAVRLTAFNLEAIAALTQEDDLHLETMGHGKRALFVIIPAADTTYNFLVSMMYSQLFETLYFTAETACEGLRLPRHVRFLLDEFANIGQIPEFTNKLATMRKYEISCAVIVQNLAQLKTMYHDDWETIIGNCDAMLFLGGKEYSTLEYISKELGDQTITTRNSSRSRGKSGSSSLSYNKAGRKLMFPDEIGNMPNNECLLMIRGVHPFKDKKFDYLGHKNYRYTGDADEGRLYIQTNDNTLYRKQTAISAPSTPTQAPPAPSIPRQPMPSPQQRSPQQPPFRQSPNTVQQTVQPPHPAFAPHTQRTMRNAEAGAQAYTSALGGKGAISDPIPVTDMRTKYGLTKAEDIFNRFTACFPDGLEWLEAMARKTPPQPAEQPVEQLTPDEVVADTTIVDEPVTEAPVASGEGVSEGGVSGWPPYINYADDAMELLARIEGARAMSTEEVGKGVSENDIPKPPSNTPDQTPPPEKAPPEPAVQQPKPKQEPATPVADTGKTQPQYWNFGMPDESGDSSVWNF